MKTTRFEYRKAESLEQALEIYEEFQGNATYLSGGTDLLPRVKLGLEKPRVVIDLKGIPSLSQVEDQGQWVRVGSLVRLFDLKQNSLVKELFPALQASLEATSCETLQMKGTIGGNLLQNTRCLFYNQSEFWRKSKGFCFKMGGEKCNAVPGAKRCFANYCSDNAVSLHTLSAELELLGPKGQRRIKLEQLYSNKSGKPFKLEPGEILASILIPKTKTLGDYEKLRVRGAIDYPLLGVAFSLVNGSGKLAIGGIGARPNAVELAHPIKDSLGEALNEVQKNINPVNNTVLDRDYRKRMIPVLASRVLNKVLERAN